MRVAVLGGGPAGIYFAYLWQQRHPGDQVVLFEQNPADVTWGFGVAFSDRAMEFLRADDPETADLIEAVVEQWANITIDHAGETIVIDGIGFSAVGRLELLQLLQQRLATTNVDARFNTQIDSPEQLRDFDLVVVADGVNSVVRRAFEGEFATSRYYISNKFIWYGTTKRYETLTQTFVNSKYGCFNAHHYRYSKDMSTFIAECGRDTWLANGFDTMPEEKYRGICEEVFAEALDGHPLISNGSYWRTFPWIWNEHWSHRQFVLVGDALHTAHYSIGSGTRLAMEDVIALVRALEDTDCNVEDGLALYEQRRKPIVEKLVNAAKASADWYETFDERMKLTGYDFAHDYICRSGRVDDERLRKMAPRFMTEYETRQVNKVG